MRVWPCFTRGSSNEKNMELELVDAVQICHCPAPHRDEMCYGQKIMARPPVQTHQVGDEERGRIETVSNHVDRIWCLCPEVENNV